VRNGKLHPETWLSPPEFACHESHMKIIRDFVEGKLIYPDKNMDESDGHEEWITIVEDDIKINTRDSLINPGYFPLHTNIVYMEHNQRHKCEPMINGLQRFRGGVGSTIYAINLEGARRLLELEMKSIKVYDGLMFFHTINSNPRNKVLNSGDFPIFFKPHVHLFGYCPEIRATTSGEFPDCDSTIGYQALEKKCLDKKLKKGEDLKKKEIRKTDL
jgi:GR25 family glycosyltransferase involved in LPS biosynthesis